MQAGFLDVDRRCLVAGRRCGLLAGWCSFFLGVALGQGGRLAIDLDLLQGNVAERQHDSHPLIVQMMDQETTIEAGDVFLKLT